MTKRKTKRVGKKDMLFWMREMCKRLNDGFCIDGKCTQSKSDPAYKCARTRAAIIRIIRASKEGK